MTDEVQALAEVAPVTDSVETASIANVVNDTPGEPPAKVVKTYTQDEFDAATTKTRKSTEARLRREWEREQAQRQAETHVLRAPVEIPPLDQFQSPEAYAEALALKKAQELVSARDSEREKAQVVEAYHEREEEARSKYDDFEQVAYNPNVRITTTMAETIQSSEIGPDVAYYLGSNPKEADRISRLSPLMQAREIGKIEAVVSATPPVKKSSNAPAPIAPVTARSVGSPAYDTTDPRSIKTMSTSDWIAAERARQLKKSEAQRLR